MSEDSMEMRRSAEASEWLVRLRDESHDEATVSNWLRWCETDPANAAAFECVQRMWRLMDEAIPSGAQARALLQTSGQAAVTDRAQAIARSTRGWRRSGFAVAASVAVAVVALWSGSRFFGWGEPAAPAISSAESIRENRTATLPDGSLVELGAKTSVAVDFSYGQRLLLLSPGQAYFNVKPDKKRPFIVQAGAVQVTAVGTSFDVKHQGDSIVVTVQEGVVAVSSPHRTGDATDATPWHVSGGYQFVYSEGRGTATLSSVDTSAVLAWRDGRLEYTRAPLADVVSDINRYALHPIEIEDPAIAKLTFTGTVFTDSIDSWLVALPGALQVQVARSAEGTVRLRPAQSGSNSDAAQAIAQPSSVR
jgi:transmembrane sensor